MLLRERDVVSFYAGRLRCQIVVWARREWFGGSQVILAVVERALSEQREIILKRAEACPPPCIPRSPASADAHKYNPRIPPSGVHFGIFLTRRLCRPHCRDFRPLLSLPSTQQILRRANYACIAC